MNAFGKLKRFMRHLLIVLLTICVYVSVRRSVASPDGTSRSPDLTRFNPPAPLALRTTVATGIRPANEPRGRLPVIFFQAVGLEALEADSLHLSKQWLQIFAATDHDRQLVVDAWETFLTTFRKMELAHAKVVPNHHGREFVVALDPVPFEEIPEFAAFTRCLADVIGEDYVPPALKPLLPRLRHGGKDPIEVYFTPIDGPQGRRLQLAYTTPGTQSVAQLCGVVDRISLLHSDRCKHLQPLAP